MQSHYILNNLVYLAMDHDLNFNTSQTQGHPFGLKKLSTGINTYHDSFLPAYVVTRDNLESFKGVIDNLFLYQNMYIFLL